MGGLFSTIGNLFTGGSGSSGQQASTIASPFQSQYGRYQPQLWNLVNNPSSVTSTPGYQFQFDQGMQALERMQAAAGTLNSGQADTAAIQYGQGFAQSSFMNWEKMLAELSGAGFGSPGAAGQLYMGGQGPINQLFSNLGGQAVSGAGSLFDSIFGSAGAAGGADAAGSASLADLLSVAGG